MNNVTLYQAEDELLAWANTFEMAETDEERLEIASRVHEYLQVARDKRDRFVQFLGHIDSQIQLAKLEEGRLYERRQALVTMKASLEAYTVRCMESLGVKKMEGNTSTLALHRKPPSVIITDESKVPLCFKACTLTVPAEQAMDIFEQFDVDQSKVKYATSKTEIAKALKDGVEVPGADLAMGGNSLRVR